MTRSPGQCDRGFEQVAKYGGRGGRYQFAGYSTVTDLARFRGWSTLQPRLTAT
jgi:hypothetical protein